ncbi:MAG: hypothetical protein KKG04_06735 [Candidatus Thermoplasmatota archaeon]|nr:hypothetical protein [Candidatus Thermoplasmatota archaeon]
MKRLCAYFDDESVEILEKYSAKYGGSTANLLRRSLQCLKNCEEAQEKTSWDHIIAYVDFLAKMEHVILDIAHWKVLFSQIGDGSDKFWEELRSIGEAHYKEYLDKGLRTVQDMLEYVENTNWYRLSVDAEDKFTLVLTVSESSHFVKTFFEGLFRQYPRDVEFREESMKIRIRVQ